MTWILAITISIVTFSIANLLQRVLMEKEENDALGYSAFTQLLSGVLVLIGSIVFSLLLYPSLGTIVENKLLFFIALSGIAYAINAYSGFKALKHMEASKFIIIYASRSILTVIFASFFLSEKLSGIQLLGMVAIIGSIVLVNASSAKELFKIDKGEVYALLGAFAFAVGSTTDKYVLNWFEPMPYLVIGFFIPGLILLMSRPKMIKEFPQYLGKEKFGRIFLYTFLYTVAAVAFYYAFKLADNVALVSAVGQVSTILTVILGIVILKERDDLKKKILAGALSFVGLLLLTL